MSLTLPFVDWSRRMSRGLPWRFNIFVFQSTKSFHIIFVITNPIFPYICHQPCLSISLSPSTISLDINFIVTQIMCPNCMHTKLLCKELITMLKITSLYRRTSKVSGFDSMPPTHQVPTLVKYFYIYLYLYFSYIIYFEYI